jgi:signal transduction histidine kinase
MRGRLRWSLRRRLVAAFVAVTLVAIVAIALEVVPTLESSLAQGRLGALARDTGAAVDAADARSDRGLIAAVSARTGAAATLLAPDARRGGALAQRRPATDSGMAPPELGTVARRLGELARSARRTTRVTAGDGGDLRAVVAVPVPRTGPEVGRRGVVVVEERLDDVARTVSLVRRRVVLGGLLGILVAAITGTVFAVGLSTRLRRLEQGSRDVAAGRFATRFEVDAREDELGSLARSLDTMQRQLRELDSSRKRFIATASHELRTPLQSLSGFVELLQDEELDEQERDEFLGQLAVQVERLTRLTFDLLDLSRLEAGGVELRPEDTDLQELAQRVAAEFRPVVELQGRALRVRLVGSSVQQWCDPDRVAQIVRVLVDNALKHSDSDDAVEIRVARSGGAARIAVTDHGPGIAPEELPHLFEPFHGTGDGSGAGLGLAIARELAHRMRGSLTVDARPGTTTFTLELPA